MGKPASSCFKIMGCGGGGADTVDNDDLLPEEVNFVLVYKCDCDWGSPIRIVGVEVGGVLVRGGSCRKLASWIRSVALDLANTIFRPNWSLLTCILGHSVHVSEFLLQIAF